ncbi:MAG: hypothetical protein EZS28_000247 [Streblomastix strix]|uniref:Uncharacterized protein n=1 Tax=Streblomastix strix TaxID=222440 RepID=A0A5J4XAK1_9EUKA|nr:MAG: hypothetical protein EZS28_000247 [Streblomastix strix]
MQQAVERIRLFAAMGYCCVQKEYYVYETTLNVYSTMFNNALISFIQTMERALTKYQQSKKSGTKIISSQDENQINIISNVFFSFGCLLKKSDNAKLLDNLNQHLMMILSLLHANCKCPFNIAFPPVSISNIVAGSFFVLSQNFALDLLYVLIHDSEQITLQVISNSKLIGEIMKIALGKGGSGKDNDNVTSTDVEILSALLWKFHEQNDKEEGKQLSNEILEQVEFDGMAEECDVLLYHTDIRQSVGVVDRAFKLWNRLSLRVIP